MWNADGQLLADPKPGVRDCAVMSGSMYISVHIQPVRSCDQFNIIGIARVDVKISRKFFRETSKNQMSVVRCH